MQRARNSRACQIRCAGAQRKRTLDWPNTCQSETAVATVLLVVQVRWEGVREAEDLEWVGEVAWGVVLGVGTEVEGADEETREKEIREEEARVGGEEWVV